MATVTGSRSNAVPAIQPQPLNSETLPEQVGSHGLQSSEPSSQGSEHQDTVAPASNEGGLGGGRAGMEPGYLTQVRRGVRDVRLIRTMLRRPDWQMPEGAEKALPIELYLIAHNRTRSGGDADHKVNMRIKAMEVLQAMKRDNDRKLVAGVRLNQIGERTALMRENPHLLLGATAASVTNNTQVVVYLPPQAPMAKYELPRENE